MSDKLDDKGHVIMVATGYDMRCHGSAYKYYVCM